MNFFGDLAKKFIELFKKYIKLDEDEAQTSQSSDDGMRKLS